MISQGKKRQYKPVLYLEPTDKSIIDGWKKNIEQGMDVIHKKYSGLILKKRKQGWEVVIRDDIKVDSETQFSLVVKKYLQYLHDGHMPQWEISAMLSKYYTTTLGLEKAVNK